MSKYLNIHDSKKLILSKINKIENCFPYKKNYNKLKKITLNINKNKPINKDKENIDINDLTVVGNLTFQQDTCKINIDTKVKDIINKIKKGKPKNLKNNQLFKTINYHNITTKLQKPIINQKQKKNISSFPLFSNYIKKTLSSNYTLNKNIKNKFYLAQRTFSNRGQNKIEINEHSIGNSVAIKNISTDGNMTKREKNKSADISPKIRKIIKDKNTKNNTFKNNSMMVDPHRKKKGIIKLAKNINNKNKDDKNKKKVSFSFPKIIINKNPEMVEEYLDDIYNHLKSLENLDLPKENYMKIIQKDINEKMRTVLIDWLVDVHAKFKLVPETLFLTINIIDRYLSKKSINRKYLQLLGITSMLLASKYEDIYPPEIKEFLFMTNNTYNREELIYLESDILDNIEFNLTYPTSLRFLEIYKVKVNLKEIDFYRCRYFIEIALFNYNCCHFSPRLIAGSSIYLNYKLNKIKNKYLENKILKAIEYDIKEINPCLNFIISGIKQMNDPKNKYNAIKRKFGKEKYMKISKEKIDINTLLENVKIKN